MRSRYDLLYPVTEELAAEALGQVQAKEPALHGGQREAVTLPPTMLVISK